MDITAFLLPFLTFLGGVVCTAVVNHEFTSRAERRRILAEKRFKLYMALLDLQAEYFWFTTCELHNDQVSGEVRKRAHNLSWQIADMLREADAVEFLDDTLDILFSNKFATARERYDALSSLTDRLGLIVNPKYFKKIKALSAGNVAIGKSANAPGAT